MENGQGLPNTQLTKLQANLPTPKHHEKTVHITSFVQDTILKTNPKERRTGDPITTPKNQTKMTVKKVPVRDG